MRILILTQYFPPEVGAPQNRLLETARLLQQSGNSVEILTAMPNYPELQVHKAYRGRFLVEDEIEGLRVVRTWIYASRRKTFLRRLANYFSFVVTSILGTGKMARCDIVLCESPPLFLGMSAWVISLLKRAKFVFNISDLWPETAEKLGIVGRGMALQACYALEAFLYRRASLVSGQTQGIVASISQRFPMTQTIWVPNGVDGRFYQDYSGNPYQGTDGDKKRFIYAGVIGHAQGLEVIIEAARLLGDSEEVQFVIVGDEPEREQLEESARDLGEKVSFLPPVSKSEVVGLVSTAYGYIVPLRKLDLFKGAIPSKIFDALALGVPILLGVDGEARELFIGEAKAGLYFEPENGAALAESIRRLLTSRTERDSMGQAGRDYVKSKFDRQLINQRFLQTLKRI